jgi:cytochrome c oxidase subunit 4
MCTDAPLVEVERPAPEHGPLGHVVPRAVLLAVFAALVVLTVITVTAATPRFDFGSWNVWIALFIATIKAGLVALYFMHLRYDNPFYGLIFVTALLFLAVFLGIVLLDVSGYQADIRSG